jgi:molybdate transport system regulatory protein
MEAHVKLWVDENGKLVISGYRARLLRHIHDSGSLARSAAAMRLSYRRAWGKIRELEQNYGVPLVHSDAGGAGGGRSRLTDAGVELLLKYESFSRELETSARLLQEKYFGAAVVSVQLQQRSSGQGGKEIELVADDAVNSPTS